MSFTTTTNYSFKKTAPGTEFEAWGPVLNDNWDAVDTRIKTNADAIAAATTVAPNSVNNTKLSDMPSNTIKGCITAGDPVDLTATQVKTILGITGSIADGSVTNAKLANMPANTMKGVTVAGVPTDMTVAQVTSLLGISGGSAPLNSPAFTGTPTAPTASVLTNTTQLATTAFVYESFTERQQNGQSGTSYTLAASDAGKVVTFNNAGAITLTVNTGVMNPNVQVDFIQLGAGQVTFAGSATRRSRSGSKTAGQYARASIWFLSADEYVLSGDTSV